MEQTSELDDLLPSLAKALRDGMGATWVRIRLRAAGCGWLEPVGIAGQPIGDSAAGLDLVRTGEQVGRIDLGPKRGGYATADLELLATVAGQATTAVANVRLATQLKEGLEELSRSRARLIAAQDAERRRIERDLHDGIQQEVVALIAGLRLARNRLSRDQLTAEELTELQDQAREMLRDLRELAHGIHPPVLSDNGLIAALESRLTRFPLTVEIVADDGLRDERFSEDVEGTAYSSPANLSPMWLSTPRRTAPGYGCRVFTTCCAWPWRTAVEDSSPMARAPVGWPTSAIVLKRCTGS